MNSLTVPALLAFGSNLGDRVTTIRQAQDELIRTPGIYQLHASPLRETIALTPNGPTPHAPRYLNAVATLLTDLSPYALLDTVHAIEQRHGRQRDTHWGDRTLDIDLILYADTTLADKHLTLPHPRAHERDFVLAPWLDLTPDAVLPGHGRVDELLATIGDTTQVFSEAPHAEH